MADPLGVYFTNPPSRPRPPSWRDYLIRYILPGLVFFGTLKILSIVLAWWS